MRYTVYIDSETNMRKVDAWTDDVHHCHRAQDMGVDLRNISSFGYLFFDDQKGKFLMSTIPLDGHEKDANRDARFATLAVQKMCRLDPKLKETLISDWHWAQHRFNVIISGNKVTLMSKTDFAKTPLPDKKSR